MSEPVWVSEREREAEAAKAADWHYTRLHLAKHDPRIAYHKCPECKTRGWR